MIPKDQGSTRWVIWLERNLGRIGLGLESKIIALIAWFIEGRGQIRGTGCQSDAIADMILLMLDIVWIQMKRIIWYFIFGYANLPFPYTVMRLPTVSSEGIWSAQCHFDRVAHESMRHSYTRTGLMMVVILNAGRPVVRILGWLWCRLMRAECWCVFVKRLHLNLGNSAYERRGVHTFSICAPTPLMAAIDCSYDHCLRKAVKMLKLFTLKFKSPVRLRSDGQQWIELDCSLPSIIWKKNKMHHTVIRRTGETVEPVSWKRTCFRWAI